MPLCWYLDFLSNRRRVRRTVLSEQREYACGKSFDIPKELRVPVIMLSVASSVGYILLQSTLVEQRFNISEHKNTATADYATVGQARGQKRREIYHVSQTEKIRCC